MPKQRSKGLGDDIQRLTKATGIKAVVDWFHEKTGIDCGCDKRRERLNKLFPRKPIAPKCMTRLQYETWTAFKGKDQRKLQHQQQVMIAGLHADLFHHNFFQPCTCDPRAWQTMINEIDKIYQTYEDTPPQSQPE